MKNINLYKLSHSKNRVLILTSLAVLSSPLVLPLPQAVAGTLTTVVNFNRTNGASPKAGVLQGTDGNIYGTTSEGGSQNRGTAFKLTDANFSALTTLVSFGGTNGTNPIARLFQASDGNYYGTTSAGGTSNRGTVFKLTPTGGLTSYSFSGSNGQSPQSALIESDGFLYGTTYLGGASNRGTIFRVPLGGGSPVLVASFNGNNGANPTAALLKAKDGNFYGTASTGGANNRGAIYRLAGGNISLLFSFNGTNGATPNSTLIQLSNGAFYGTASAGGTSNRGTVFRYVD